MVEFLSSDFFEAARRGLREDQDFMAAAQDVDLDVQFVVAREGADGDVVYALRTQRGNVDVVEGRISDADITIHSDYDTAAGISDGSLNTQMAFISGRLRLDGDMAALMRNQDLIQRFSAAMSRMDVTY